MKRTISFVLILAVVVLSRPVAAEAQQEAKVHRVGVLSELSHNPVTEHRWRSALRGRGYVEGENLVLIFRWAEERFGALPRLAAELVDLKVDLILTSSTPTAAAAKKVTTTIPIITQSADPVGAGLVSSLARPGQNVTGVFLPLVEMGAKRLQLLREVVSDLDSVAIVWNPANRTASDQAKKAEAAAETLGVAVHSIELVMQLNLEAAFAAMNAKRVRGLIVMQDPVTLRAAPRLAELAARYRLASSHAYREFVDAGGLMSYGVSLPALFEATGRYADKVLKGASPADLPMEQPNKYELVINLKAAKALGLTIPPALLLRADQVIE